MFRVFYTDSTQGQRWTLCGRLAGPWVDELRSYWRYVRERATCAHAVVDLSDVTFVDEAGEALLAEMQNAGSELVASGVENRHLLDSLKRAKPNGRQPPGQAAE
jgi:ABC-type transporter Mla MlaB component